jgi:hypothetical protein
MATQAKGILVALGQANGYVALGLQVGAVVIPLIKGLLTDIKSITTPQGSVEYTVVISADQAELLSIAQQSVADLVAINAELVAQGAKPLDVPPTP